MNKLFGGLGIGHSCSVQLEFRRSGGGGVPTAAVKSTRSASRRDETEDLPVYRSKDTVEGEVKITPIPGKRVDHAGIRVQLVGEIELASERGYPHEFLSLVRDLAPPGDLPSQQAYSFSFDNVEMQHDSYLGLKVRLRYLLRVTVARGLGQSTVKDFPFWVRNHSPAPPRGEPIKMEVGIEDCLHIEFEYDSPAFHLDDVVIGRIFFLLVRVKIKHMELEIKRRESVGAGAAARSESDTVAKYEIMDGAPARGEVIPIRLFLAPYDLSPSVDSVHNRFSVKYFLNLVLVDEEDRRYFKQQEITLYRAEEGAGDGAAKGGAARLPRGLVAALPEAPPPNPVAAA
ncbi:VPS26 [Auxenochlorella protothecoides x Auxenochlorella symbiontica]|uniref:Vacuolar protein sorting-associated protein 26B n=2 Tax=Auxenochlorella protothecoides TaxID=3075 RepID=A0A087SB59_AUXPR|nr:Vacuolar protein sorting-associated protein 26B [Auxenochlorella protothecoides]KFM22963.1 Vacuolar protein sorting-associated protein 26B [Auxenochlorella protothecoides]